jgi:hypothetical protein
MGRHNHGSADSIPLGSLPYSGVVLLVNEAMSLSSTTGATRQLHGKRLVKQNELLLLKN